MFEKRERAGRDQVAGGLAPRVLEHEEEDVDLELREVLAVDFGVEQHAEQIVARLAATLLAELIGVRVHLHRRFAALLARDGRVEPEGELGELEHVGTVFFGNTDEIGDHVQREPQRDVGDEIARGLIGNPFDERVDALVDPFGEIRDAAGCETGADELAQSRVLGRVLADQDLRETFRIVVFCSGRSSDAASFGTSTSRARRARRRRADDGPVAALPVRVAVVRDRRVAAQIAELLVREPVGVGGRIVQDEAGRLHAQVLPRRDRRERSDRAR